MDRTVNTYPAATERLIRELTEAGVHVTAGGTGGNCMALFCADQPRLIITDGDADLPNEYGIVVFLYDTDDCEDGHVLYESGENPDPDAWEGIHSSALIAILSVTPRRVRALRVGSLPSMQGWRLFPATLDVAPPLSRRFRLKRDAEEQARTNGWVVARR